MQPIRLQIAGFAAGAEGVIEPALRRVPGVMSVRFDPADQTVSVEAGDTVRADDLVAAVRDAGYNAVLVG